MTQEQVNIAQKAHIYAFSGDGPRGNAGIPQEDLNRLANLMLVCHECHRKMDSADASSRYTAQLLQQMKDEHERRIEIVSSIDPCRRSHVVLYGANIGAHSSPLSFKATAPCLFPNRYPADHAAIELGMVNSSLTDHDDEFWRVERDHLIRTFNHRIKERLASGAIEHLSVFALAPQPLLVLLGSLLTDIPQTEVYQLRREPQGWGWAEDGGPAEFTLTAPHLAEGPPALVLSLSASIQADRIRRALRPDVTLWHVTIPDPNNDFLQSRGQLREFRQFMRRTMDRIKATHGQETILHVFPAVPVAVAVELGRIHMPKADLRFRVYDQVGDRGFVPAIDVPKEDR